MNVSRLCIGSILTDNLAKDPEEKVAVYNLSSGFAMFAKKKQSTDKGAARTLKKLRTSKGHYWIKQSFSSIAPLFKMGNSLKEFAPRGSEFVLLRASREYGKSLLTHKVTSLECYYCYYAPA